MPSAGRFVGAVCFMFITWYASEVFKTGMPEGTNFGNFSAYNAAIGAVLGWVMLGLRAHGSKSTSLSAGLTAAVAILFWVLLIHSLIEMVKLSLRKSYDGPVEALIGMVQLMIKYFVMLATPEILIPLIVGGLLTGMVSGWAQRRYM